MSSATPEFEIGVWPLDPPVRLPPDTGAPEVSLSSETLAAIQECAEATPSYEVGGVLLGDVAVQEATFRLDIIGHIPAEAVESGPAHLTFTHETWRRLRVRRFLEYPHLLVLGWYHTHPGLGVFLSTMDRGLHRQVFGTKPWSVALVLDSKKGDWAFFWPCDERVYDCPVVDYPLN